jgi:hypothetical protein
MDRRHFLHTLALTAASAELLSERLLASDDRRESVLDNPTAEQPLHAATEGYSAIADFEEGERKWQVYEDLRQRDGSLLLISSAGPHQTFDDMAISKRFPIHESLNFTFQAELLNAFNHPVFGQGSYPFYALSGYPFSPNVQSQSFGIGGVINQPRAIELRANIEF